VIHADVLTTMPTSLSMVMEAIHAIMLNRVTTEEQKEAGNSLPAQIGRIDNYCKKKSFEVIKSFSFDESAYKEKRDEFDMLLECLDAFWIDIKTSRLPTTFAECRSQWQPYISKADNTNTGILFHLP
jgi:predicted site-specific integrase-resolvase